ncbi:hypothetical protein [Thermoflexus sp.]|uniref:hypothetical protein n=1 Tax=Thermoflexus sp. TaxID=1969742 RepID=UPI0035E42FA4
MRDGPRFLAAIGNSLYLDERAARVERFHPIEAATASLFFPDLMPVLTLSDRGGSCFLQLRYRRDKEEARLLWMAPAPALSEREAIARWEAIFHAVVEWAAARRIRRLVAEVALDELRPALLRRLGFQRTRRYMVWSGSAEVVERAFEALAGREPGIRVSPWALYRGARGAWVEELRSAQERPLLALAQTLADLGTRWRHPVYVQVRWENAGLTEALRALGFQPAFAMGRMVRWIAVPYLLPAVEELEISASTSLAFYFHRAILKPAGEKVLESG